MIEMKVYVGTSGFAYGWNPEGSFDWYAKNSNLNTLELNASFYRFPFPNQVKAWVRKTELFNPRLRWSIKVNRFVTHVFKFSERALSTWRKFESLFKPLDKFVDFYLFQLPPSLTSKFSSKLEDFIKKVDLKERFALEVRNLSWFDEKWINWAKKLGITWVSVDAPDFTNFPREIYSTNGIVYLRMHGRFDWYSHNYSDEELREVLGKIRRVKPKRCYIYFNNDTNMLRNARRMLELFKLAKIY